MEGKLVAHDLEANTHLISTISDKLDAKKEELKQHPTAASWLQYNHLIDILRCFLKAERTGNWHLHLRTLQEMIPFLASAGHSLYTKSIQLYLQDMVQLEQTNPDVYNKFQGHHIFHRSDRYLAGLSVDLLFSKC